MGKLSRTYRKWDSMIARCHRPSHPAYQYYGGRKIFVCERWRNSYQSFLEDMGEAPEGMWIDRIDSNKGYEPGNVRWVTPKESAANRRKRSQVAGSLRQLARSVGIPYHVVYQRVKLHFWPIEKALTVPVQKRGPMTHYAKRAFGLMP